jgi:hypothetical protein
MQIPLNLDLSDGNYTFAFITKCQVNYPYKTFSGLGFTFELTIAPSSLIEGKGARIERLVADIDFMNGSGGLYLGQLKDRFISSSNLNYSHGHQLQLELSTDTFLKLVDETHFKDLELKIRVQALLKLEEPVKNSFGTVIPNSESPCVKGEAYLRFPHSDWLKVLDSAKIERFDLITLRTYLPELPGDNVFTQAFDKLREAQDKFNRGDWNATGASCRSALRTVFSLTPQNQKAIEYVLSGVAGDPRRKSFAFSLTDGLLKVLNSATHLEGDHKTNTPPADLQREDALLCLHWTAAIISYIATVCK